MYTFYKISVKFENTKIINLILKISRPGVFDIICVNWNTVNIVFSKKFTHGFKSV